MQTEILEKTNQENLDSPFRLDLDKHGIIEASAGTGKTFTLENLVVRLLFEKFATLGNPLSLSKILIVTFTEKATGELKNRIRKKIESEKRILENNPQKSDFLKNAKIPLDTSKVINNLKNCLDHFDSASVFTIHGFCNKILRDYSFENGELFHSELIKDSSLLQKLYIQEKRKYWHHEYGEKLYDILNLSGFGKEDWEKLILEITDKFKKQDSLCPEPISNFSEKLGELQNANIKILHELKDILGKIDESDWKSSDFVVMYKKMDIPKDSVNKRIREIIKPVFKIIYQLSTNQVDLLPEVIKYLLNIDKTFQKDNHFEVLRKFNKAGHSTPQLDRLVEKLEELRQSIDYGSLKVQLQSNTIFNLHKRLNEYKRKNGYLSYEDMLEQVLSAITNSETGKELLEKLRKDYLYAFVDEFQDTDNTQWEIFKTIFLANTIENRLFVIGDPKQAIYSFRGADINTYNSAKKEMQKNFGANLYNLNTNYRSTPKLIAGFNWLFQTSNSKHAFSSLSHQDIQPPTDTKTTFSPQKRTPIVLVKFSENSSGGKKRLEYAEFIAKEIRSILSHEKIVYSSKNKKDKPLDYGDICVLVRNRSEAKDVLDSLGNAEIPVTFYKKQGIYQSSEALQIYYLLHAICYIANEEAFKKALLTGFFAIPLETLSSYSEIPIYHPVKELFTKWSFLAQNREYPKLFHSVLHDTGYEIREIARPGGERILANSRQIFHNLEQTAIEKNLEFEEVVNTLQNWKNSKIELEEELNTENLDSEKPKIKVMTIHTSKGLEYPIVFLAGGFTEGKKSNYYKFHKDSNMENSIVYDLMKQARYKEQHLQEEDEENDRIFYVAITRAMFRVYIPYYKASRVGGFLSSHIYPLLESKCNSLTPEVEMENEVYSILETRNLDNTAPPSQRQETTANIFREDFEKELQDILISSEQVGNFGNRSLYLTSYSNEKKSKGSKRTDLKTALEDLESLRILIKDDEAKNEEETEQALPQLPSGKTTGNVVHKILEEIDYSFVKQAKDSKMLLEKEEKLIQQTLKDFGMLEYKEITLEGSNKKVKVDYKKLIADMVFKTLRTTIPEINISLADLDAYNKCPELEFYYPVFNKDKHHKDIFIKGEIDLLFCVGERFYILDWKTDTLSSYQSLELSNHIQKEGYDYQYNFYTLALHKWLDRHLENYSYEKNFGGVYYIFLRGFMEEKGEGLAFIPPDKLPLENVVQFVESHFSQSFIF
ncbi:MAG: UvrD-helicase domain-containing protein [Leptospiraceae bacterium]|nr:UvrD-helicase domain-containing protein [Leptospiraceae bacterium]